MTLFNQNHCEYCSQPFYAERSTKRYCSDSCKQLSYLERKAQKLSQASFIETVEFEIVDNLKAIQQEDATPQVAIEVESHNDTDTFTDKCNLNTSYNLRKPISRRFIKRTRSNGANNLLFAGGIVLAGYLIRKIIERSDLSMETNAPTKSTNTEPAKTISDLLNNLRLQSVPAVQLSDDKTIIFAGEGDNRSQKNKSDADTKGNV